MTWKVLLESLSFFHGQFVQGNGATEKILPRFQSLSLCSLFLHKVSVVIGLRPTFYTTASSILTFSGAMLTNA